MSTTDYAISIALILIVVLQVRRSRMTLRSLVLPVVGVALAADYYLKGVPTAGNDVILDAVLGAVGGLLGGLAAVFTTVWRDNDGVAWSKAGALAGALWVVGVGSRLAFEEYVTHGGMSSLIRFSAAHQITSQSAWVAALVIMALAEVVVRQFVLRLRGYRAAAPLSPPNGAEACQAA